MGKMHESITPELASFIEAQPLFFVATAPLSPTAHVNVSPKGLDTLRLLAPDRAVYLDLTGSGNETAAHLAENGRITLLFCAFAGKPRIVRLYGTGTVVMPHSPAWGELRTLFDDLPGARQIIAVEVTGVQTSCGFGVPLLDHVGQRDNLPRWAEAKGPEALIEYRARKNATSIDGLPAPTPPFPREAAG